MERSLFLGVLSGTLLIGMLMVMSMGEAINKEDQETIANLTQWPNLSCFGYDKYDVHLVHRRGILKEVWWLCLLRENATGFCAKTCYFYKYQEFYLREEKDWFDFYNVMEYTRNFLGYGKESISWMRVMKLLGPRLETCMTNHPEYKTLKGLMNSTCEPWTKILDCVDHMTICSWVNRSLTNWT